MLLLLVRLGLRAGEVVRLQLDDIDWRAGSVLIRAGKTRRERVLPLRFQKQFRLGQDALANHARAFAPGGIELPGLPRVAT